MTMLMRRAVCRGVRGARWNSNLSIEDLQQTIKMVGKTGESSKGMEQLKSALALLQEEVEEKKRNEQKKEFNYYIVHTTGPERIGMIAQVSSVVSGNGMDILASRATLLGGDFSMMIHVRTDSRNIDKMKDELEAIPDVRSWVHDASATTDESGTVGPGRVAKVLLVTGENQSGIISAITKYLKKRNAYVMNMASEMVTPPLGGPPAFKLRLVLDTPGDLSRDEVLTGLNAVAATIGARMKVESYVHCSEE